MFRLSRKHTAIITIVVLLVSISLSFIFQHLSIVIGGLLLTIYILILHIIQLDRDRRFDKTHMTSLFENATEGIILTNQAGDIVLVNPAAEKMFNYNAEDLIGKKIEILIPEKYRRSHIHLRENFHKKPENRVMGHGRDLHGTKKNGQEFPVEVSLSFYKQNNQPFAIAFIIDITHRKQIEKSMLQQQQELEKVTNDLRKFNIELEGKVEERTTILKEALMKLEQSQTELSEALDKERQLNEIKSRFVSMASHEFRTPLSTVLSSASLLSKYTQTEDQEKRNRHIDRIKDSVKHLNNILEDFLNLGKLDEGKVTTHFSQFNIQDVIAETTEEIKGLLKRDQQIVQQHEGHSTIFSDKNLFKNILINLITNASKFSDEQKIIRINSRLNHEMAEISVSDEGIGISMEDQNHLFSSFFRGHNALNIPGTGLGLHIVKRYIDLLHGSAGIKSELNKGTTVYFSIPVNQKAQ